jgi:hypothetical protein
MDAAVAVIVDSFAFQIKRGKQGHKMYHMEDMPGISLTVWLRNQPPIPPDVLCSSSDVRLTRMSLTERPVLFASDTESPFAKHMVSFIAERAQIFFHKITRQPVAWGGCTDFRWCFACSHKELVSPENREFEF